MIIGIDASRVTEGIATGTERYSREVIDALLRLAPQHEYRLYVRNPSMLPAAWTQEHVQFVPIPQRRMWTHIGLAREVQQRPPDALFIPAHVLPVPQAIHRTTHSVVTIHDVGYRHFPHAHSWRQRLYLDWSTAFTSRYADCVVVDSQATYADVRRFYHTPATKLYVAYPGRLPVAEVTRADEIRIRTKFGLDENTVYALFVGTLQPRKNLRRLIQAWVSVTRYTQTGLPPLLLIAGPKGWGGDAARLQDEVSSLGMQTTVRFMGYIDDLEKSVLLQGARAFAYPSLYEGFGFPVLEAQSVGVPVVCANTSSLPEVAGEGALQVDPTDVQALALALQQALYDNQIRNRLMVRGNANVLRFTWEQCANQILQLLEKPAGTSI